MVLEEQYPWLGCGKRKEDSETKTRDAMCLTAQEADDT